MFAQAAAGGDRRAAAALAASPELATTVPDSEYEQLLDFADALGVEDYFWQEGGAAEESFIPPSTSRRVAPSCQRYARVLADFWLNGRMNFSSARVFDRAHGVR